MPSRLGSSKSRSVDNSWWTGGGNGKKSGNSRRKNSRTKPFKSRTGKKSGRNRSVRKRQHYPIGSEDWAATIVQSQFRRRRASNRFSWRKAVEQTRKIATSLGAKEVSPGQSKEDLGKALRKRQRQIREVMRRENRAVEKAAKQAQNADLKEIKNRSLVWKGTLMKQAQELVEARKAMSNEPWNNRSALETSSGSSISPSSSNTMNRKGRLRVSQSEGFLRYYKTRLERAEAALHAESQLREALSNQLSSMRGENKGMLVALEREKQVRLDLEAQNALESSSRSQQSGGAFRYFGSGAQQKAVNDLTMAEAKKRLVEARAKVTEHVDFQASARDEIERNKAKISSLRKELEILERSMNIRSTRRTAVKR